MIDLCDSDAVSEEFELLDFDEVLATLASASDVKPIPIEEARAHELVPPASGLDEHRGPGDCHEHTGSGALS